MYAIVTHLETLSCEPNQSQSETNLEDSVEDDMATSVLRSEYCAVVDSVSILVGDFVRMGLKILLELKPDEVETLGAGLTTTIGLSESELT